MNYKNLEKAHSICIIKKDAKYLVKQLKALINKFDLQSIDAKDILTNAITEAHKDIDKRLHNEVESF